MQSQDELVKNILQALDLLEPGNLALLSYLYQADNRLPDYLSKFKEFTELSRPTERQRREAGKLLEEIVFLAFKGLRGVQSIKSFQSAGPQYDLLVTGNDLNWHTTCKNLYLDVEKRDIVIEAKAKQSVLADKDFARLCSIMENNLRGAGLGIFITIKGASGFPRRGDPRQRRVSDCRLRQIIFHAKTNKIIVVMDKEDIFELGNNGALLLILIRKIRDLFELSGLDTTPVQNHVEIDVPPHLATLREVT